MFWVYAGRILCSIIFIAMTMTEILAGGNIHADSIGDVSMVISFILCQTAIAIAFMFSRDKKDR